MDCGFYIFLTIVRAPSGLVATSTSQPDSLQGEAEGGLKLLAVTGELCLITVEQAGVAIVTASSMHLLQQTFIAALPWARPCAGG